MQVSQVVAGPGWSQAGREMGTDAFLRLLVTQLRFQDPLEPVGTGEFLGQLAQFVALDETRRCSMRLEMLLGTALLGKSVRMGTDQQPLEGVATAARYREGQVFLTVGDQEAPLSRLLEVLV